MSKKPDKDGWSKRFKGNIGGAWIHTHPNSFEGRAIVENHNGISFNGEWFETLEEAKKAALKII